MTSVLSLRPRTRLQKGTTAAALAVSIVGGFEGLRLTAYPDPATRGAPWTICYGETRGVKKGDRDTKIGCDERLITGLAEFAAGVEKCVPSLARVPDKRYVAHVSLAWNIGVGGYCKSSIARLQNAGHDRAACDFFLKYNRAAGIVFPGLTRRRQAERAMCLEGL
jgi:lysozyme